MSDISREELKKEIAAFLKDADLTSISSKKVRQEIEKKLDIDLSSRRKEVDELVMEYIDNDEEKSKKNGNVDDDDDEEEEENEDDEEEDEDEEEEEKVKKPKRGAPKKGAPSAKRNKTASSDESDDASEDEDDEYSPKKKGSKKGAAKKGKGKKKGGSDDDSDEDWGKNKRKKGPGGGGAKKASGGKRAGSGYTKSITLSPELAALVGENSMPRHEVVRKVWAIIKERNLYDPKNKQYAICDDELLKVFGVKRFRTFGMMKFLKNHFKD